MQEPANFFRFSSFLIPALYLTILVYGIVKQVEFVLLTPILVMVLASCGINVMFFFWYGHKRYVYGCFMMLLLLSSACTYYFFGSVVEGEMFAWYGVSFLVIPSILSLSPFPSVLKFVDEADFRKLTYADVLRVFSAVNVISFILIAIIFMTLVIVPTGSNQKIYIRDRGGPEALKPLIPGSCCHYSLNIHPPFPTGMMLDTRTSEILLLSNYSYVPPKVYTISIDCGYYTVVYSQSIEVISLIKKRYEDDFEPKTTFVIRADNQFPLRLLLLLLLFVPFLVVYLFLKPEKSSTVGILNQS